jgi:hypothetical protein
MVEIVSFGSPGNTGLRIGVLVVLGGLLCTGLYFYRPWESNCEALARRCNAASNIGEPGAVMCISLLYTAGMVDKPVEKRDAICSAVIHGMDVARKKGLDAGMEAMTEKAGVDRSAISASPAVKASERQGSAVNFKVELGTRKTKQRKCHVPVKVLAYSPVIVEVTVNATTKRGKLHSKSFEVGIASQPVWDEAVFPQPCRRYRKFEVISAGLEPY